MKPTISAASHDLEGRWNQGNKRKHGTVSWKKALEVRIDVGILTPPNPKKVAEGDGGVIVRSSCSHLLKKPTYYQRWVVWQFPALDHQPSLSHGHRPYFPTWIRKSTVTISFP
ncbi:hypothetical protein C4D60_Mb04t26160 [Musa balbisiana]|uniref:Uncharacterized protein n=1 Tax=Musa balbisiana TaxID=52838 RepID=A0A4S8KEX2_MUSBA|nr:hypothetical protein C4D60_Mb04t26160 [Musa balbisiana]